MFKKDDTLLSKKQSDALIEKLEDYIKSEKRMLGVFQKAYLESPNVIDANFIQRSWSVIDVLYWVKQIVLDQTKK